MAANADNSGSLGRCCGQTLNWLILALVSAPLFPAVNLFFCEQDGWMEKEIEQEKKNFVTMAYF